MAEDVQETRSWQDQDDAAERAVDEMRRGIQRVREQVRTYREVLQPDHETQDEA